MDTKQAGGLPLIGGLRGIQVIAMLVLVLMTGLSIIGLVWSDQLYPNQEQVQSFMTNDLVNLILGVPVLIAALLLIRGRKLTGLLLLPGAMLYVVYNSIAYLIGRPFDIFSIGHLTLIAVSAYGSYFTLSRMDRGEINVRLSGGIPAKFSGWVLAGFGALFFFRAVGMFANSLVQSTAIPISEVGVLVADMILSGLLFAGGVMLLRKRAMGVAAGLGLLYAASMLFIGLIVLLVVQSLLSHTALPAVDILVVALMGSVCFIPFVRYLRACARRE